MNPRTLLLRTISLFALLLTSVVPTPAALQASKPNIIVILSDDSGGGSVGCYGAKGVDLPTWILKTIIPATFAIMSPRFLLRAIRALRRDAARQASAPQP